MYRPAIHRDLQVSPGRCGGRFGKEGQGKRGAKRGFVGILQDFEGEGVAKEEQKLGGGAHQGQSGWSKTTGVTDL
ncbi:hypothetical protein PPACK8108_LOCUS25986 [Phakopsora pachyrhizi]|uniref:Uncharacterized protein n=1 Tax=Phakopsora pachyrhizi TaxID=170000 RepID=A0AAV0BUQ3_PHAPC|nr:hypothetical protein PPACK8108_LOCUS25986 [Phakopsora pachyrhizi]